MRAKEVTPLMRVILVSNACAEFKEVSHGMWLLGLVKFSEFYIQVAASMA